MKGKNRFTDLLASHAASRREGDHPHVQENPVIHFKGVHLFRDRSLLEDIDWTVRAGEHWVILGRNGAGKTLLLNILAGYLWPSKGEVRVLGEQYGYVDLRKFRRRLGWVTAALNEKVPSQDTVLEVVLSGAFASFGLYVEKSPDLVEKAKVLLDSLGLGARGTQTFSSLSVGEKQRCLLARSLICEPDILILDEPCSGLDLAAQERFLARIQKMTEQKSSPSMIMVTHRVSEITPGFTHGMLLHHGRQIAAGPLNEVLNDDDLSRTMEIPVQVVRQNGRWHVVTDLDRCFQTD